jgi:uncharacterized protein (TIGR00730 family)
MTDKPTICVYCGSSPGKDPAYLAAAETLGKGIAEAGWRLIYGAGDLGLMGATAKSCLDAGGEVIGVIPDHLRFIEGEAMGLTALIRTETMHERKKVMFATADAFIVLPGGAGTVDETIETLTWRQLGLHEKPLAFVDVDGYWQPMLDLLKHMNERGFMGDKFLGFYEVAPTPQAALEAVRTALS